MAWVRAERKVTAFPRLAFTLSFIMAKSISDIGKKKRRGRPSTGTPVLVRLPDSQIKKIDKAAEKEGVSRSEKIRELIERSLS